MNKTFKIKNLKSLAIPENVTTGTAELIVSPEHFGRNWTRYESTIKKFAKKFPGVRVVIYSGDFADKYRKYNNYVKKMARQKLKLAAK